MQRQSLGSPVSKLHIHGGAVSKSEDIISVEDQSKRKAQLDSPPSSLVDGQERKQTKPCKFSYSPSKPDRLIHLIPVLILLCFLVLFLCSHRPSRSDLAEFRDFKLPSTENIAAAEIGRLVEVRTDDVLAIRKLQETVTRGSKCRYHRKSGDF